MQVTGRDVVANAATADATRHPESAKVPLRDRSLTDWVSAAVNAKDFDLLAFVSVGLGTMTGSMAGIYRESPVVGFRVAAATVAGAMLIGGGVGAMHTMSKPDWKPEPLPSWTKHGGRGAMYGMGVGMFGAAAAVAVVRPSAANVFVGASLGMIAGGVAGGIAGAVRNPKHD